MASFTDMAQMALSHLGSGKTISNIETEQSDEARALRTFQDTALEHVLRAVPWSFATQIEELALVEEDPNDEWAYSYRYPTDALMIRKIQSGLRTDSRQSRVPYRIAQDDSGRVIFTDIEDAIAEVTVNETDSSLYPADFVLAFTYYWAFLVAPRVTKGDPFKLKNEMFELYKLHISYAFANSMNEDQPDQPVESEFIRTRE